MSQRNGSFVISLDFELMWGVRDEVTIETYGQHVLGVHKALPRLLTTFSKYDIHATFAAVGFLFFENKKQLLDAIPSIIPQYDNPNFSPYVSYINDYLKTGNEPDRFHFAPHLIDQIMNTPNQELATHTFSHYYCIEKGQTIDEFEADLKAAIAVGRRIDAPMRSIIFPRNQVNNDYLKLCKQEGISCYRGNEISWIYSARSTAKESLFRRFVRLMDAYVNLSGHHCVQIKYDTHDLPVNIPSSRFLRPFSKPFRYFEGWRLKRITNSMTFAAKHNLTYHLWWHPHNFGINQDENFAFLEKILAHYQVLQKKYGFESKTMYELSKPLADANGQ